MDTFLYDIVQYLKKEEEIEKILALTLRDIFLNDLIYITFTNEWKQYSINTKQWSNFKITTFINKLEYVLSFYEKDVVNYINNNIHESIERFYLLKQVRYIRNYVMNNMDHTHFIEKCEMVFKVGD